MRSGAHLATPEIVRRVRLSAGARQMLDIGGSHGYYSVAFCREYPALQATILDLPQAIEHAAPLLAREGMGERVVYRAGGLRCLPIWGRAATTSYLSPTWCTTSATSPIAI